MVKPPPGAIHEKDADEVGRAARLGYDLECDSPRACDVGNKEGQERERIDGIVEPGKVDVARGHEAHLMAKPCDLTHPKMSTTAHLHPNEAERQPRKERQHLRATQLGPTTTAPSEEIACT